MTNKMNINIFFSLIIILQVLDFTSTEDSPKLEITRSISFKNQTGDFTPLVVTLSSPDIREKIKDVDLICVLDVSYSMDYDNRINLAKESLKYLVNLMNERDNFALVRFSGDAKVISNFTQMTPENKTEIIEKINDLKLLTTGTNIYSGLEEALKLFEEDYSSSERIASIVLLSDGEDNFSGNNLVRRFENLLLEEGKNNYTFTLHTVGYGQSHDSDSMSSLSKIKDGGYFFIYRLSDVQDAFLKIYGALSTVLTVNLNLTLQSIFKIEKVYEIEDMYKSELKNDNDSLSSFNTKIIHVVYGKKYNYVVLVDIPNNTSIGTEVLNATTSPPLELYANYIWNNTYSTIAYEEYIRVICITYIIRAYNSGSYYYYYSRIMNEGKSWLEINYNGSRNWLEEFDLIINDFNYYSSYGKANIISKLRELKISTIGIHYAENDNSYSIMLVDSSHYIETRNLQSIIIRGEKIINYEININYYYFYLKEGTAEINNIFFSGNRSSLIIYNNGTEGNINITALSDHIEYYFWNETKTRIQSIVDFSHQGKFIYKKDFPFEFYTRIDEKKDITFNIEFLKLEYNEISENKEHLFEIIAYILDENALENINDENYEIRSTIVHKGSYNNELKLGKIVIKKELIVRYISRQYQNYLYIVVKKLSNNTLIYNNVEGKFIFIPMRYTYSILPENYYISSELTPNEKYPHLYTIQMEYILRKNITIEFTTFGDELDCKILKYQDYPAFSELLFVDYKEFTIIRRYEKNILYIDIFQSNEENTKIEYIIISIFSKNEGHIPSSDITKISYNLRYTTYSYTNGFYNTTYISNNYNAETILLGFSKYNYIKETRIGYFYVYFASIRRIIYSKKVIITLMIKYKNSLEFETKEKYCELINSEYDNQKKYNCSLETNSEEIEKISINKTAEFDGQNVEILSFSSIAGNHMSNLLKIERNDLFERKIFIFDNCSITINNEIKEVNITGSIKNESEFNYDMINLTINTQENEGEVEDILCNVLKLKEENYTLQCNLEDVNNGDLRGAISQLEDEILVINFPNDTDTSFYFKSNNQNPNATLDDDNNEEDKEGKGGNIGIIDKEDNKDDENKEDNKDNKDDENKEDKEDNKDDKNKEDNEDKEDNKDDENKEDNEDDEDNEGKKDQTDKEENEDKEIIRNFKQYSKEGSGLTAGGIVGIVLGSVAAIASVIGLIYLTRGARTPRINKEKDTNSTIYNIKIPH